MSRAVDLSAPAGAQVGTALDRLQQIPEVLDCQSSLLQDVRRRRPFDRTVRGNHELQRLLSRVLVEPDVATTLPNDDPAIAPKRPNYLFVAQARDFAHTGSSMTSAPGPKTASSSAGSRYNWIASRMFASASSRVSPSLMQPGSTGTTAVNPPSSLGSNTTRSFTRVLPSSEATDTRRHEQHQSSPSAMVADAARHVPQQGQSASADSSGRPLAFGLVLGRQARLRGAAV